jgi:hypothetical protein
MAERVQNYNAPLSWSPKRHQPGGMAAGANEGEQAGRGNGGGGGVVKRMAVDLVGFHQLGIEDDGNAPGGVIDEREGGDRTRFDAEDPAQDLGTGEGQAGRADQRREGLELDRAVLGTDDEPELIPLVLEKEILDVAAGNLAAQRLRLLDGEDGRVLGRQGGDPEFAQASEQILRGGGHAAAIAFGRAMRNKPRRWTRA